jgi:sec-independent protein translocase protein TatC
MSAQTLPVTPNVSAPSDDVEMTFTEHLAELRNRLLVCIATIGIVSLVALPFMFNGVVLRFVEHTFLRGIPLHVFSPPEIIRVYLKLSIFIGIVVGFPVVLYETYAFVAPALDRRVRRRIVWYAIPSFVMSALGIAFCGVVVLPLVMRALLRLTVASGLVGTYQLEPTIGFIALLLAIFAAMFQMPIVLSILASVGLVNSRTLARHWRIATMIIVILAAIAAPDGSPLTMSLLAAPLLMLYALSIVVVHFTQPKVAVRRPR